MREGGGVGGGEEGDERGRWDMSRGYWEGVRSKWGSDEIQGGMLRCYRNIHCIYPLMANLMENIHCKERERERERRESERKRERLLQSSGVMYTYVLHMCYTPPPHTHWIHCPLDY